MYVYNSQFAVEQRWTQNCQSTKLQLKKIDRSSGKEHLCESEICS